MNRYSKAALPILKLLFVILSFALTGAISVWEETENPRSLPSLKIAWKWKGDAEEVVVDHNIVFLLGKHLLTAINTQTGKELWQTKLSDQEDAIPCGIHPLNFSVAAALNNKVFLVDKESGKVMNTVEFNNDVRLLIGLSLIVWLQQDVPGEGGTDELVQLDEKTGEVINRKALPQIREISFEQGIIIIVSGDYSENPVIVFGLRENDFTEIWNIQIPHFAGITTLDGRTVISRYRDRDPKKEECDYVDELFTPIDPQSGQLGDPLPEREPSEGMSSNDKWIFQFVASDEKSGVSRYRRNNLETGMPLWNLDLNCNPQAELIDNKDLFLHCSTGSGRGYFMRVDWQTGEIKEKAYGLRNVQDLLRAGEYLAAFTYDGEIVVFSPTTFGPPEASTLSVESEVNKILHSDELISKECWWQNMDDAYKDLNAIGKEALPVIAKQIDELSPSATAVAARVLGDNGYTEAASSLATKLPNVHRCSDAGWAMHNPPIAILQALAKIGSKSEFESIKRVAWNEKEEGEVRLEAFATLVTLADSETKHDLDETINSVTPKPFNWFVPPDPGKHEARLGTPVTRKELMEAYQKDDYEEAYWLNAAATSVRIKQNGRELIIFPYSSYGGPGDLWFIERSSTGQLSPAQFLGISVHDDSLVEKEAKFEASLKQTNLVIKFANKSFQVDLASLNSDQDSDGLPDILERRLRTDPQRKDTDNDGIIDSEDLSPDKTGHATSEQEQITQAIFNQYFAFTSSNSRSHELSVIVNDVALDWKGLKSPCITLTKEEDKKFLDEAGYDGIAHISINPGMQNEDKDSEQYSLGNDERLYSLTIYRGGLNAVGYDVIVRQIDKDWYIKRIIFSWIS